MQKHFRNANCGTRIALRRREGRGTIVPEFIQNFWAAAGVLPFFWLNSKHV
jgi:hypothetical protein